jgi:hypothetical protein
MTETKNEPVKLSTIIMLLTILFLFGLSVIFGYVIITHWDQPIQQTQVQTQVQTPVQTQTYSTPFLIKFNVLKASAAQPNSINQLDKEYSVLTTNGDIIIFSDYYSWDEMIPQQSYTCTIADTLTGSGRTVYSVTGCKIYNPYLDDNIQVLYGNSRSDYVDYRDIGVNYYTDYYNRNYDQNYDYDQNLNNYDHNTRFHKYYHYGHQYWDCNRGMCTSIALFDIPNDIDILESTPPFTRSK